MDYEARLKELYGLERFGIKLGLDTVRELLERIGNPHESFRAIHVTGTNGKGSVCAFLDSVLRAAGYCVGMYTSPHLVRFNERIRVDGRMVSDADVVRLYDEVKPHADAMAATSDTKRPTFFEVTTAMAFRHFADERVDAAIVEVGMGGRLDATNVLRPKACAITRIGLEHTEHLGRSVERIAREKAGILKSGVPAVTVDQPASDVIRAQATALGCPLTVVGRDLHYDRSSSGLGGQVVRIGGEAGFEAHIPLLGVFQPENAAVAVGILQAARGTWKVSPTAFQEGFRIVRWPGRLQVVRRAPTVIVDGAHNAQAAEALAESLRELFPGRTGTLVLGILNDKDLTGMARALGPFAANVIAARPKTPRAFEPGEIVAAFSEYARAEVVPDVKVAVARAVEDAADDGIVVVTGSIYTAGEALELLGGSE